MIKELQDLGRLRQMSGGMGLIKIRKDPGHQARGDNLDVADYTAESVKVLLVLLKNILGLVIFVWICG